MSFDCNFIAILLQFYCIYQLFIANLFSGLRLPALVSKPSERNQFPVRPEEKQEEHGLICKDGCHCYYSREVNEKKKLIQN